MRQRAGCRRHQHPRKGAFIGTAKIGGEACVPAFSCFTALLWAFDERDFFVTNTREVIDGIADTEDVVELLRRP